MPESGPPRAGEAMSPLWIWIGAVALYALFSLWYVGGSGPLTPAEIDRYLARLEDGPERRDPDRLATLRKFLEQDDGREFFMANLARLPDEPVADPTTGEFRPAGDVLREYTGRFLPSLFRRAGHPAFFGRTAGGYVEQWGVAPDPGWSFVGIIRYRSRRDMMELATSPAFAPAHAYKLVSMSNTLAFPTSPGRVFLGPRVWVALVLGLLAALTQILVGRG